MEKKDSETKVKKEFYCESPKVPNYNSGVFTIYLAGGIKDCTNWQKEAIELLLKNKFIRKNNIVILNPRRETFDENKEFILEQQYLWEREHINRSSIVLFWFPKETHCPIALFDLGHCMRKNKKIFIGCDKEYKKRKDLILRSLPNKVCSSLETLIENALEYIYRKI